MHYLFLGSIPIASAQLVPVCREAAGEIIFGQRDIV